MTYCFKCPTCGAHYARDTRDEAYCEDGHPAELLRRDWKGENAALLRENIRAVPRG